MNAYDSLDAPNPGQWLALDEGERLRLVIEHHRQTGVELPSEEGHAAIHVVVENQAALGDEVPTQATLARLMREGSTGMMRFMPSAASSSPTCKKFLVMPAKNQTPTRDILATSKD